MAHLGRLFGRARELAAIDDLFLRRARRHVSLAGPPGIGKSAIAMAYAERHEGRFVAAERAQSAQDIADGVAAACGLGARGGLAELCEALAARGPTLLVLDGLDALPSDVTRAILAGFAANRELRVLVTTREATGDPASSIVVEPLPSADAVALLADRAGSVRDVTPAALEAIVGRLHGLPLAIVLAAARLAIVPPDELLARLDADLSFLGGGLDALVTQAMESLDPLARSLLVAWATCPRGFDLRTAEAVAPEHARHACVEVLATLRARGLVQPSADVPSRFVVLRMFATPRDELAEARFDVRLGEAARAAVENIEAERPVADFDVLERDLTHVVARWLDRERPEAGWAVAALAHHALRRGASDERWRWLVDAWPRLDHAAADGDAILAAGLALTRALRGRDVERARAIVGAVAARRNGTSLRDGSILLERAAIEELLGHRAEAEAILDATR